jgi:hypothetical protein
MPVLWYWCLSYDTDACLTILMPVLWYWCLSYDTDACLVILMPVLWYWCLSYNTVAYLTILMPVLWYWCPQLNQRHGRTDMATRWDAMQEREFLPVPSIWAGSSTSVDPDFSGFWLFTAHNSSKYCLKFQLLHPRKHTTPQRLVICSCVRKL